MSANQRARGATVTRNGRAMNFSIDPLTHSRVVFASHLIPHTLDVPASMATVVRAAVAHYLDHLEVVAKRLRAASESAEKLERLREREQYRVRSANRGGDTRWKAIPEDAMRASPMPTWADLERSHQRLVEPLPAPESFRPFWLHPDDKDGDA